MTRGVPPTEAQLRWIESVRRAEGRQVVDWKTDNCGMGVYFVTVVRPLGRPKLGAELDYCEAYVEYPVHLLAHPPQRTRGVHAGGRGRESA